eukprot:GHVU01150093.1.p1 GENE.GHVU01150093.1~~GHVU01150093.1.p1  ORF type:complete len:159 (+),score=42.32 GHVU01150093.1:1081-1557(+)
MMNASGAFRPAPGAARPHEFLRLFQSTFERMGINVGGSGGSAASRGDPSHPAAHPFYGGGGAAAAAAGGGGGGGGGQAGLAAGAQAAPSLPSTVAPDAASQGYSWGATPAQSYVTRPTPPQPAQASPPGWGPDDDELILAAPAPHSGTSPEPSSRRLW